MEKIYMKKQMKINVNKGHQYFLGELYFILITKCNQEMQQTFSSIK